MSGPHDVPLVGPGHELQLTIDGRAIPHADVVAARAAQRETRPAPSAPPADDGVAPGQTALSAD